MARRLVAHHRTCGDCGASVPWYEACYFCGSRNYAVLRGVEEQPDLQPSTTPSMSLSRVGSHPNRVSPPKNPPKRRRPPSSDRHGPTPREVEAIKRAASRYYQEPEPDYTEPVPEEQIPQVGRIPLGLSERERQRWRQVRQRRTEERKRKQRAARGIYNRNAREDLRNLRIGTRLTFAYDDEDGVEHTCKCEVVELHLDYCVVLSEGERTIIDRYTGEELEEDDGEDDGDE